MYVFTVCTPLSTLDHDGIVGFPAMNEAFHLSIERKKMWRLFLDTVERSLPHTNGPLIHPTE